MNIPNSSNHNTEQVFEFDCGTKGIILGSILKETDTYIEIRECDTDNVLHLPKYYLVEKIARDDLTGEVS